jgi:hypothetical protein
MCNVMKQAGHKNKILDVQCDVLYASECEGPQCVLQRDAEGKGRQGEESKQETERRA